MDSFFNIVRAPVNAVLSTRSQEVVPAAESVAVQRKRGFCSYIRKLWNFLTDFGNICNFIYLLVHLGVLVKNAGLKGVRKLITLINPFKQMRRISCKPKHRTMSNAAIEGKNIMFSRNVYDKYTIGESLGTGTFGDVMKVRDRETFQTYAIKIVDKKNQNEQQFYSEISIMKELNHKHIIYVHEAIVEFTKIYMVMEYVDGGDLFNVLDVEDNFSEKKTKIVIAQLASALKYIHSRNIVHRDIKAENVLVKKNCEQRLCIKLADFGLATHATAPLYDMCGTPAYMAPEIIKKIGYGVKVDVWATGILMYFILSGYLPFDNDNKGPMIAYHEIVHFQPEFSEVCWPGITIEGRDIIHKMLDKNPDRRLMSDEIMQHNWINHKHR